MHILVPQLMGLRFRLDGVEQLSERTRLHLGDRRNIVDTHSTGGRRRRLWRRRRRFNACLSLHLYSQIRRQQAYTTAAAQRATRCDEWPRGEKVVEQDAAAPIYR